MQRQRSKFRWETAARHLVVPMLKDVNWSVPFIIYRREVRPFSDKQIELVRICRAGGDRHREHAAVQCEQQRTRELTESLEQQTATSEVCGSSVRPPGDLEPVFQAMLEKAMRICEAKAGNMLPLGRRRLAAGDVAQCSAAFAEMLRRAPLRATANNPWAVC